MLKLLTLVILLSVCLAKAEYYSKLGLHRGAGQADIKRSFKRLATKYHPDRAPEGRKEEYNKLFSEISDAYSVLSDPELKAHYDRGGHEALEQHRQHQEYHNQHKARQEMHESMVTDHFQGTDVQVLNMESLGRFYRRNNVWLVLFYRSQDHEMRSGLKEAILELNSKFYGIFTVAVVNCDQDDGICDEYRATNTPDIFGFKSEATHDGVRYTGDKVFSKMAGFAVSLMQSFVSVVTPDNIDDYLQNDSKIKMLLFTDKKEAPPLIRSLSKEFRSSVDIAQVKDNSRKVAERFGVDKVPSVVILKKADGQQWSPVPYEGQFTFMAMSDFIREHRDLTMANKKKAAKKIIEVRTPADLEKNGCSDQSKQVCLILFYDNQQQRPELEAKLSQAVIAIGDEPVVVLSVPRQMVSLGRLGISHQSGMILLKPSKNRIHVLQDSPVTADLLTSTVDKLIGGTLAFKPAEADFFDCLVHENTDL